MISAPKVKWKFTTFVVIKASIHNFGWVGINMRDLELLQSAL